MVILPKNLATLIGESELLLPAKTISDLISQLVIKWPVLKPYFLCEDGGLTRFVNFYVNNTDIRSLANQNTPILDTDVIQIVPSLAGG